MTERVLEWGRSWGGNIDRVWLAVTAIFAILALMTPNQAFASVHFTFDAILEVGPWLVLSICIAAYASATDADNLIARAFQGNQAMMILTAAIFGGLSPFCSCGVIPLIAALLAMGVPLAPVMAFWLASPVMDPAMFAITTGALGFDFAVAKTLAAVGLGLMGGFAIFFMSQAGWLSSPLREGVGDGGCGGAKVRTTKSPVWKFWIEAERRQKFMIGAKNSGLFLGKWLTLAFVLESLMVAYIPADLVAETVGGGDVQSIMLATLVGVPAYLNGYAAVPLVAGLIQQGMAPGAGLAFMVAGGVSSIPAAIAVWALAKKQVFFLYLGFAFVGSLMAGMLYQATV
ncbi:MAG: permease [Alphaproteobacteria bacterium]|nr:permease [Alphaproteobacteria bacterium]